MILELISASATAIGVCFAAWQIREGRKIAQNEFENNLDAQYRNLIQQIPADVLLEKEAADTKGNYREIIFNYLDLSNEQIYLRKQGRVSDSRWENWKDGIVDNLRIEAINKLWGEVKTQDKARGKDTFSMLSKFETLGFKGNPQKW